MRRTGLLIAGAALALLCAACDGDDDDDTGDATATPAVTAAAPTPTSTAPSPTPGDAAITIDEPAADTTVTSPVTMSGTANVFEAALTIDALGNAAGLVLCTRHVMATSGTGTPGTWEGVLAFTPPPAAGPITLRAYSFSPMDGSMENVVERSVIASSDQPNIVIDTPSCTGEASGNSLTVEGMALVFEAVLHVDIRDASGTALLTQRVMAASGTEFSPWSTTFDITSLAAGFYDVVAYSRSAEDDAIINEFPVQISRVP